MFGSGMGTLNVYISTGVSINKIFSASGSKGINQDLWFYRSYTVSNTVQWSVIFEGKAAAAVVFY